MNLIKFKRDTSFRQEMKTIKRDLLELVANDLRKKGWQVVIRDRSMQFPILATKGRRKWLVKLETSPPQEEEVENATQ